MGDYHSNPHHHLALPGFRDFSSFARNPNNQHTPAQAGPSRTSPQRFDNQHFMTQVNAAQHASSSNGASTNPSLPQQQHQPPMTGDPTFDILDWYPAYQSCQRYFLNHAQHEPGTQALCALINIRLPFQWLEHPIASSSPPNTSATDNRSPSNQASSSTSSYQFNFPHPSNANPCNLPSPTRSRASSNQPPGPFISLLPYLRRLLVTGFDKPAILHGLFGDDYVRGILPHLDCERRNYLFAAKAGGWKGCKGQYDTGSGCGGVQGGGGDEAVPFMKPLEGVEGQELEAAEKAWGRWLCMEDWMLGPNAPQDGQERGVERDSEATGMADGVVQGFEGR